MEELQSDLQAAKERATQLEAEQAVAERRIKVCGVRLARMLSGWMHTQARHAGAHAAAGADTLSALNTVQQPLPPHLSHVPQELEEELAGQRAEAAALAAQRVEAASSAGALQASGWVVALPLVQAAYFASRLLLWLAALAEGLAALFWA